MAPCVVIGELASQALIAEHRGSVPRPVTA